jgi:GNAT superfamily N-acetyltransferase
MTALALIRSFVPADAGSVAHVHVETWRQAYAGIIDADVLAGLDAAAMARRWQEGYDQHRNDPARDTLVAVTNNEIVGFLSYGPARDAGRHPPHEIYAINILKPYWGLGLGHTLFLAAAARLRARKASQAYLWVLQENSRALAAYQKWGGRINPPETKTITIGGQPLQERRVTFSLTPAPDI